MSTTLHLFRHDVSRLRWWLAAWAGFWVWALNPDATVPGAGAMDTSWFISGWGNSGMRRVLLLNITHAGLSMALLALLFVPHGPDDPRLFWRTRPLTARAMLQAKALFIGLFFVVFPMLAESVFWHEWLTMKSVVEFLPGMLGERLAWSGGLAALVVLGGREPRRYQLTVMGMLGLGFLWMLACEQITFQLWRNAPETQSPLPTLPEAGLGRQLWEFFTRPPARAFSAPDWATWIGIVGLTAASWLVVGCRYLTPDWRAVRLAVEVTLLGAVVAGHICLRPSAPGGLFSSNDAERNRALNLTLKNLPLNAVAELVEVRLRAATHRGTNRVWGTIEGVTFHDVPTNYTSIRVEWDTAGEPPGTMALAGAFNLQAASRTNRLQAVGTPGVIYRSSLCWGTSVATTKLTACVPELAGYRLLAVSYPPWEEMMLQNEAAAELLAEPVTAVADLAVDVVRVELAAVMPLNKHGVELFGEQRLEISRGEPTNESDGALKLRSLARIRRPVWDWSFLPRAELDLMAVRNPMTKEAFVLPAVELNYMHRTGRSVVAPMSPSRGILLGEHRLDLDVLAARHGFDAVWLQQAELLCLRLTLVGHVYRKVTLENFRLEPAAVP